MAFDLDKLIAERPKSSPRKKKFSFTFDGKTYTLPNEIDALGLDAAIEGEMATALRRALTIEQYDEIKKSSVVLDHGTIRELLNAYYDHVTGLRAGESAASSPSSKSTARPSKPTSKRTTKSRSRNSARR